MMLASRSLAARGPPPRHVGVRGSPLPHGLGAPLHR